METLLIIGGSSTALEIRECAELFYSSQYKLIYNVIGDEEETTLTNVIRDNELDEFIMGKDISYIIGFTNLRLRKLLTDKLSSCRNISIIHPSSFISPTAKVGDGSYIAAMAVVSSNAIIGQGCIVNIGVSIGHDAFVGDNCILNPGVRISGHCHIGSRTLFGANSFIFQGKSIGEDCAVDAMTYIDQDIADKKLCTNNVGGLKVYKNRLF